jgi:hypothetical protein
MARLAGFEPATLGLEGRCSIQMSYRRKIGRGREIRTPDILLPKQARYQTALYPVYFLTHLKDRGCMIPLRFMKIKGFLKLFLIFFIRSSNKKKALYDLIFKNDSSVFSLSYLSFKSFIL